MCIAIAKRPGVVMKADHLASSFRSHSNGAGYAFVRDGKLEVRKGFMQIEAFISAYQKDEAENPESHFLIHCRTSTSGNIDADNTHPFLGKECAVIHNGVFFAPTFTSPKSDTRLLIEASAEKLTKAAVVGGLADIEKHVGSYNKMCFLFPDNTIAIANEKQGEWDGDVWYSNSSYKSTWGRRDDWGRSSHIVRGFGGRDG